MAALNVTQAGIGSVAQGFSLPGTILAQLEKISCWKGDFFSADPFSFFGQRIRVGEHVSGCDDDEHDFVFVYGAKVVGVDIGLANDGVEVRFLLKPDGSDFEDSVDISRLTVLEVLE